ncbi:MAG TPA: GNAT family N-acetyltransferase, partial [Anaerolineaceae bacterium]|nr:GNAT family N-acetyltransferase [Anaerolineaceae bacterium]
MRNTEFSLRHLDWRASLEWLGHTPFWLAVEERTPYEILATLACPPEIPDYTWIRLFASASRALLDQSFALLLENACAELPRGMTLTGIGLYNWFSELLATNGFNIHQHIVILEWGGRLPPALSLPASLRLRPMEIEDLDEVHEIDNLAFEPLWQNSQEEVLRSLVQSAYSTVAEVDHHIIGYQISTGSFFAAHLARLAIHPKYQHQSIGYLLVEDLQQHFLRMNVDRLTVNTQNNNAASLA